MSETNIGVAITADVADLQTKLALAQSEFRNFSKETKAIADEMTAAGEAGKDELLPSLQAAAAGAGAAKAEINSLNAELRESAGASHEASSAFVRIRESMEGLHASITETTGLFTALGELFLVGFGIERIGEFVLKSAELGEEMLRTSQKTGIAVEQLSELKFAAETSGVSFDSLQTGLKKLAVAVQEALLNPTSKAADGFRQLGVETAFLEENQNNLEAILRKVAAAYQAHADGLAKSANASAIMGKGGTELITMLNKGSAGLDEMAQKARDLGAVMGTEQAEHLEQIKVKVVELDAVWTQFKANITDAVAGPLTSLIGKLNELFALTNSQSLKSLTTEATKLTTEIALLDAAIKGDNFGPMTKDAITHLDDLKAHLIDVQAQIDKIQHPEKPEKEGEQKPPLPQLAKPGTSTTMDIDEEKRLTKELDAELADRQQSQLELQKEVDADYAASVKERYDNEKQLTKDIQAEVDARDKAQKKQLSDYTKAWQTAIRPIQTAFDGMLQGMLSGTLTFQQATQRALQGIVVSYLEAGIKALANWLASEAAKTAAVIAGVAERSAAQTAGEAEGAAAHAASAQTSILTSAYEAAAGAYQSASAIPYVGWIIAPFAAAGAFIAVEAFGSSVPSAAGGWDIPAAAGGIPMIAHGKEMVLPASLAEGIRGMVANSNSPSGSSGSTGDTHFHIYTQANSADGIAAAVGKAARDFHPALRNLNKRRR